MLPLVLDDFIYLFKFLKKNVNYHKKKKKKKKKKPKWTTSIPSPLEQQNKSSARDLRNLRYWGIKKEREERRRGRRDPVDPQPHKNSWPIVVGLSQPQSVTHYTPKPPYKSPIHPKWHQNTIKFPIGSIDQIHNQKKKRPFFFYLKLGSNQVP